MRKTLVAAAVAFAVASGAMIGQAAAADLEFIPAPAPPPFVPTWAGFYIGGHVGYGKAESLNSSPFEARQEIDFFEFDPEDERADADGFLPGVTNTFRQGMTADGLIGGVQGGYNWQVNRLVFGIEGDVSFADWSDSTVTFDALDDDIDGLLEDEDAFGRASIEVDMLASVRGRLGFTFGNAMIYGTGGVAWADATAKARVVFDEDVDVDGRFEATDSADFNDIGYVVGGGLGWMVIPQTVSVGVEGLFYFFDEKKTLFDERFVLDDGDEVDVRAVASLDDAWVIRARADFHF